MLVDLVVQNSDFVPFSTEAGCFAARVDGIDYPASVDVFPSGLPSEDLENRERVVGRMVFEIPAGASTHELVYKCGGNHEVQWVASDTTS